MELAENRSADCRERKGYMQEESLAQRTADKLRDLILTENI